MSQGVRQVLAIEPLTATEFAPFGHVIQTAGVAPRLINQGRAQRFHDLASIDVATDGGRAVLSIFVAEPWPQPIDIAMLECHPLGSQAFAPLDLGGAQSWLVVVAPQAAKPDPGAMRCFRASIEQGVSYARGCWHHPLLALAPARFLVIDRAGPGLNLQEWPLATPVQLVL